MSDVSPLILPELTAYRERAARRRAAAFCRVPDYVFGWRILPLTPRTFSMLAASGNRFALGGSATEKDIADFLWFHSPLWCHHRAPLAGLRHRLALARWRWVAGQWPRRALGLGFDQYRYVALLVLATAEIASVVEAAFSDAPGGDDLRPAKPLATLEAQLVHALASAYQQWPLSTPIADTPLAILFQLLRCHLAARGADLDDAGEEQIKAAHYARLNADAAAKRDAITKPQPTP